MKPSSMLVVATMSHVGTVLSVIRSIKLSVWRILVVVVKPHLLRKRLVLCAAAKRQTDSLRSQATSNR